MRVTGALFWLVGCFEGLALCTELKCFPKMCSAFCHFLLGKSLQHKEKDMEEQRKALEEEKNTLAAGASKILVSFNFFLHRFHPFPHSVVNGFIFANLAFQPGSCGQLFQDQEVALERKFRVQQVRVSKCLKVSQRAQNFVMFGSWAVV